MSVETKQRHGAATANLEAQFEQLQHGLASGRASRAATEIAGLSDGAPGQEAAVETVARALDRHRLEVGDPLGCGAGV